MKDDQGRPAATGRPTPSHQPDPALNPHRRTTEAGLGSAADTGTHESSQPLLSRSVSQQPRKSLFRR